MRERERKMGTWGWQADIGVDEGGEGVGHVSPMHKLVFDFTTR